MVAQIEFVYIDTDACSGDREAQELLRPKRASAQAAGYDIVAANKEPITLRHGDRAVIPTGIAIALQEGWEAQVRPRSGLALRHGVTCLNAPGTIDADYRGEIGVILINLGDALFTVSRGMRIAQLVVARSAPVEFVMCAALPESQRGTNGFGSTGTQASDLTC